MRGREVRPAGSPRAAAPLGFAHRGGMGDRAENSLDAFRSALARGVRALEADVRLQADGVPLLSHGRARPGTPSLAELFDVCGTDFDLSLDLPDAAADAVVATACAAGHDPARLWLCGSGPALVRWRALAPQVRLVSDARVLDVLPHRTAWLDALARRGVSALNLRRRRWTPGLAQRVHAAGLLAFAWDVQTRAGLERAVDLGLDGVYCDHVELLLDVLHDNRRRP